MRHIVNVRTVPLLIALGMMHSMLLVAPPELFAIDPFVPFPALPPPSDPPQSVDGESIAQVPPASVICDMTVRFDGQGSIVPGTNYNGILISAGTLISERFQGQTRSTVFPQLPIFPYDDLNEAAGFPLTPQTGAAGQNVDVVNTGLSDVLAGLGPLGYPQINAIGEGSLAILFPCDQTELKFDIVGGGGDGVATVQFFRADGGHIDNVVVATTEILSATHGFARVGGGRDIRGISIINTDGGGIGIDNICYTGCATPVENMTWGEIKARFSE